MARNWLPELTHRLEAYSEGTIPFDEYLDVLEQAAKDPHPHTVYGLAYAPYGLHFRAWEERPERTPPLEERYRLYELALDALVLSESDHSSSWFIVADNLQQYWLTQSPSEPKRALSVLQEAVAAVTKEDVYRLGLLVRKHNLEAILEAPTAETEAEIEQLVSGMKAAGMDPGLLAFELSQYELALADRDLATGRVDLANLHWQQAKVAADRAARVRETPYIAQRLQHVRARILLASGRWSLAIQHGKLLMEELEGHGHWLEVSTSKLIASAHLLRGEGEDAEIAYDRLSEIRMVTNSEDVLPRLAFAAWKLGYLDKAHEYLDAFDRSEKRGDASNWDLAFAAVTCSGVARSLDQRKRSKQRLVSTAQTLVGAHEGGVEVIRPLLKYQPSVLLLEQLCEWELHCTEAAPGEAPRRALEHAEAFRTAGWLSRRVGAQGGDLGQFQASLSPSEGALVFVPGVEQSFLFVVSKDHVEVDRLEGNSRLLRSIEPYVSLVTTPPGDRGEGPRREGELAARGEEVFALLFGGDAALNALERWSSLVFVGGDLLAQVPLESLPFQDGWLGAQRAITHSDCLSLSLRLASRSRLPLEPSNYDSRWLVLAAPSPGPLAASWGREPLHWTDEQLELLVGGTPDVLPPLLSGSKGTRPELVSALQGRCAGLIVYTHGIQLREGSTAPALLLAPTGEDGSELLEREDILDLSAPPLVILAACEARGGTVLPGNHSANDLTGAFLAAGADGVLASPFSVSARSTQRFVGGVTRALAHGRPIGEARRQAQLELSRQPEFADPFFHGLFSLVGVQNRALFSEGLESEAHSSRRWVWGSVLIALGILSAAFLVKRGRRSRGSVDNAQGMLP